MLQPKRTIFGGWSLCLSVMVRRMLDEVLSKRKTERREEDEGRKTRKRERERKRKE